MLRRNYVNFSFQTQEAGKKKLENSIISIMNRQIDFLFNFSCFFPTREFIIHLVIGRSFCKISFFSFSIFQAFQMFKQAFLNSPSVLMTFGNLFQLKQILNKARDKPTTFGHRTSCWKILKAGPLPFLAQISQN